MGKLQFFFGCFLRFFDVLMENDDALPGQRTEEGSSNPFFAFGPDLKELAPIDWVKGSPKWGPNTIMRSVMRA